LETLGELAANPKVAASMSGLPCSPLTWLDKQVEELVEFIFGGRAAPGAVEGRGPTHYPPFPSGAGMESQGAVRLVRSELAALRRVCILWIRKFPDKNQRGD
jgi:hypothetical protein